ncbi:flavoprotein [Tissierella carlieri]|uniref:flavoprotein n=1 Tax=Tissierella carlieri TaxID=689904 RepID=UPI00386D9365
MKTKITSKVLEDISKRLQGESIIEKEKEDKTLKALIVLNGSNIDLSEKIENIKKLKNRGIKVSLAFSFMAERLLDTQRIINTLQPLEIYKEEDIIKLKDISKKYSIIIGPNITMNTLSKISLGMIDTFIPNLIWTFLYQGKKVYLDFNQVKKYLGEETKNKEILNITDRYIDTIKKMGAIEIDDKNILENIIKDYRDLQIESQTNLNKVPQTKEEEIPQAKTVITEKDIISMSSNNKLILPKGTIITPLAKDKAREKNIKIEIK